MTASMLFDYMAVLLDKQAMADKDITINFVLPDVGEQHSIRIKYGVLLKYENTLADNPDLTVTAPKNALFFILQKNSDGVAKSMKLEGDVQLLDMLMDNLNQFSLGSVSDFNIVEP